ncbi:hypothetical protein JXB37_07610 [candidate division WOR-3 bacterium]|nr:hypothetical protein [candidate division WOR-3 bacterium]
MAKCEWRMLLGAALVLLLAGSAAGADIYAKRMEIVRTVNGEETVFEDSVVITDGDTRISAGRARLNDRLGYAVISDSVVIVSPGALVLADSAVYRLDERVTTLHGRVRVEQDSLVISAPDLRYDVPGRRVVAENGLELAHRDRGFVLRGRHGSYDLGGRTGVVDSGPRLVFGESDNEVAVTGRQVFWDGQESRATFVDSVRVSSGRAGMDCDTLVYFLRGDSGLATGRPEVRDSLSRTGGDSVRVRVRGGGLESLTVAGSATGSYRTEGGDRVEVRGSTIAIRFERGEVIEVAVTELRDGRLVREGGS